MTSEDIIKQMALKDALETIKICKGTLSQVVGNSVWKLASDDASREFVVNWLKGAADIVNNCLKAKIEDDPRIEEFIDFVRDISQKTQEKGFLEKRKLSEGSQLGDLENLVLPLLSIDEYESKISGDGAIVIAFFVDDEEPAEDLRNFIERSHISILDSDISPAITPEGYYVVFLELLRDKHFPKKFMAIMDSVQNLTNDPKAEEPKKWKFRAYGVDGLYELTDENLERKIRLSSEEKTDRHSVHDHIKGSLLKELQR